MASAGRKGWTRELPISKKEYYTVLYVWNDDSPLLVLRARLDGCYYISSSRSCELKADIGPYKRLREAQIAMEMMVGLDEIPKHLAF